MGRQQDEASEKLQERASAESEMEMGKSGGGRHPSRRSRTVQDFDSALSESDIAEEEEERRALKGLDDLHSSEDELVRNLQRASRTSGDRKSVV